MSPSKLLLPVLVMMLIQLNKCLGQGVSWCNEELTANRFPQLIQSVNYPSSYTNNIHCVAKIRSPVSTLIQLDFSHFNLELSDSCSKDYLVVYDGIHTGQRLLYRSCGDSWVYPHYPMRVISTGNEMSIVFVTDGDSTSSGFQATFKYVEPRPSVLVFASSDLSLLHILDRHSVIQSKLFPDGLQTPVAVDYDPIEKYIYYTDMGAKNIGRIHIDSRENEIIHERRIEYPFGMHIDVVSRLLYWTDAELRTVSVSNLEGTQRKTIIDSALDNPGAIVTEPNMGYIYYTDWGSSAKIEKAEADGSNRMTLVNTSIQTPQGLAIDPTDRTLYWVDTLLDVLEMVKVDGTGRTILLRIPNREPFSLVVDEYAFFFTEPVLGLFEIFDKELQTNGHRLLIEDSSETLRGMTLRPLYDFGDDVPYTCPRSECRELCLPKSNYSYICHEVVPILTSECPSTIYITSREEITVYWDEPTARSPSGIPLQKTQTHNPGDVFIIGSGDVSYKFEDYVGNTIYCNFTVTVTEPKNENCEDDILVEIQDGSGKIVTWEELELVDGLSVSLLYFGLSPGDFFQLGETQVEYQYTTPNGISYYCSFTVNILHQSVNTACRQMDITVLLEVGDKFAVVVWDEPVDADGQPADATSHTSGSLFPVGCTDVIYTFFNPDDQEISCSFTVEVIEHDTTAPVFRFCPSDILTWIAPGQTTAQVAWGLPVLEGDADFITLQSDQPGDEFVIGITTVTIIASDASLNKAWCNFTITVKVPDPCDDEPCLNGGTCSPTDDGNSYICECPDSFTGSHCFEVPDSCTDEPCMNGGTCNPTEDGNSYICECPDYFSGSQCFEEQTNMSQFSNIGVIIIGISIVFLLIIITCLCIVITWHYKTKQPSQDTVHSQSLPAQPPLYASSIFDPSSVSIRPRPDEAVQFRSESHRHSDHIYDCTSSAVSFPPAYGEDNVVSMPQDKKPGKRPLPPPVTNLYN